MISLFISSDVQSLTISGIAVAGLIVILAVSQFLEYETSRFRYLTRYVQIYAIPLAVLLAFVAIARAIQAVFG
jgi:hypothetical protein